MEHKKLNRIIAFLLFVVGVVVYGKTVAPTTSYWDCGEFIACSYILGVPHPPGSPLYILIGRIFTMLPIAEDIGLRVNLISVLASALTVMLTYLIIVRLIRLWRGTPTSLQDKVITYTGGVIGALALAFSDSFWFNAVEAEVYAPSIFFTALVVWLILVWLEKVDSDEPASDRILLVIAYVVGLATGVHLLNVLALPTVFLLIYFKKARLNLASFSKFALLSVLGFISIYSFGPFEGFGIINGLPLILKEFGFVGVIAFFLALFGAVVWSVVNRRRIAFLVLASLLLITVGYSTYTALYIRSNLQPAINENNPNVPERFVKYLKREQYGEIHFWPRNAPFWEYQIKKMYIRYFGWQFIGKGTTRGPDGYIAETLSTRGLMGLPFLVGLIGMFHHFRRDWKRASAVLTLFILTGVAIAIYLNQEDPQPRERDYAYVGSFFAFALWIGIGAASLVELMFGAIRHSAVLRKIGVAAMIVLLFVAVPYKMFAFNYDEHDRTGNYVAYDYSYNILQSCEPNAILFTNGDNDTFPLWFLQYVYNIRRDVRVVNLSLLNTSWYIKQLRDEEPKVPIRLSDQAIDKLQPRLWEDRKIVLPVSRERVLAELAKGEDNATLKPEDVPENPKVEFILRGTLPAPPYGSAIRVQDLMIIHILQANQFRRPVYFAVTVSPTNMLGLDNRRNKDLPNYLRMDGLAFKVMPYGGPDEFISPKKLEENLFTKFQYRNLDNPEVFYNYNIQGLLQNYRSAFLRLANYYLTLGKDEPSMKERALRVLDKMNEVMPEEVLPLRDFRFSINFARMYAEAGRQDVFEERIRKATEIYHLRPEDRYYVVQLYSQVLQNDAKAESLALAFLDESAGVGNRFLYGWLVGYYDETKQYDKAADILRRWLRVRPEDTQAQSRLAEFEAELAKSDSLPADTSGNGTSGSPKPLN